MAQVKYGNSGVINEQMTATLDICQSTWNWFIEYGSLQIFSVQNLI